MRASWGWDASGVPTPSGRRGGAKELVETSPFSHRAAPYRTDPRARRSLLPRSSLLAPGARETAPGVGVGGSPAGPPSLRGTPAGPPRAAAVPTGALAARGGASPRGTIPPNISGTPSPRASARPSSSPEAWVGRRPRARRACSLPRHGARLPGVGDTVAKNQDFGRIPSGARPPRG